jgi:hypothetical protein
MSEVFDLERQLAENQQIVKLRDAALKLGNNPEFKSLILERFCVQECARYAHSSADPALTAEQRADALNMAQAAGHLRRFLSITVQMGNHAERNIGDLEDAIEEARQEGEG